MEYYRQLDIPPIPPELIARLSYSGQTPKRLDYNQRWFRNGEEVFAPLYQYFPVPDKHFCAWIRDHVPTHYNSKSINQAQSMSTHPTRCEMIPHVDMIRAQSLNYYIANGSDDNKLTWYQEQGYPIVRHLRVSGGHYSTHEGGMQLDNLVELATVNVESNCWYLIRTDIIHGVKNIHTNRKFINVF